MSKLIVVKDWETRIYRADYLVEVDDDNEEISQRYHIYSEFVETEDSGEIVSMDACAYKDKFPKLKDEFDGAFLTLKIHKKNK